jgi:hypothetical protein
MPVQFFIGRTQEGNPQAPEYSHEMRATFEICKQLWHAFHARQPYYAVVASLAEPSLDIMVVSERGIGVMELKHYFGRISCRDDGGWYAGPKRMIAGVAGRGFNNPHEQVQAYAEQIRRKLITPPPFQKPWLPGKTIDWEQFKIHTAVCFTHPDADLTGFDEQLRHRCRPITLPWEQLSIITPAQVAEWAASLRFESGGSRSHGFTHHRYQPQDIARALTDLFSLSPWDEIADLMPGGQPYAILSRLEDHRPVQDFPLDSDTVIIGRDRSACDIHVPDRFTLISRTHARITRTLDGILLEDLGSTNGTFLDGKPVTRPTLLHHGQIITLGNTDLGPGGCHFEFSLQTENLNQPEATQKLGRGGRAPGVSA